MQSMLNLLNPYQCNRRLTITLQPGDGTNPPIQKQVGEFRFLADRTRPDIQTAVGILGSNSVNPSKAHLRGVDHLARYVKGSRDMLLTFGGSDESEVHLFC